MVWKNHGTARYVEYAIALFVVVLLALLVLLVKEYRSLTRAGIIQNREIALSAILKNHGPLTARDIGVIQPWMTFDYVNKVFNLPPTYLQNTLAITDSRYPKTSIGGYIRRNRLAINIFMEDLANALQDHFNSLGVSTST